MWGSEFTSKDAALQGGSSRNRCRLNVKLRDLRDWWCVFFSPTHKRTEGRAPVWGSEFTSKDAAIQGGSSRNRCRLNVKMCVLTDWCLFFYTMLKNKKYAYDMLMNLLQELTMNLAPTTCG